MRTFVVAALIASALTAQASAQEQDRVRSQARVATGALLFTAGLFVPFNWSYDCPRGSEYSYIGFDCYADRPKELNAEYAGAGRLGAGIGMMTVGLLLATKWSEVPATENLSINAGPGYVRMTVGW